MVLLSLGLHFAGRQTLWKQGLGFIHCLLLAPNTSVTQRMQVCNGYQYLERDPDAGKERGQEEKEMTEDEMAGWHHQLYGHEFEQAPGDGEACRVAVHGAANSQT